MFELSRDARDTWLGQTFRSKMASLGSVVNSRIFGGPFPTLVKAFISIISDAVDECISLFGMFSPNTTSGAAAPMVLGFFERPQLLAAVTQQTFTILRTDASTAFILPVGATIQTGILQSGKAYSYSITTADAVTMSIGTYYAKVVFTSSEVGLATAIASPQVMQQVSGFAGPCFVLAGAWDDSLVNPLFDIGTDSIDVWLANHLSSFGMLYRVQGRDDESIGSWRTRCFARWDEISTGATGPAYESWVRSYQDPVTGNAPVSLAKVTDNQFFHSASCTAPTNQPLLDGQEYIMAVEIAVAYADGAAPAPADLQVIADYLVGLKPHTDKVWLRAPNMVVAGAGTCAILVHAPASMQNLLHQVAASFFVYDGHYPGNFQGLGSTIYQSEIIRSLMDLSSDVVDVKVVFTLAGKVVSGDIVLDPFDQIQMADPTTGVTVTVF